MADDEVHAGGSAPPDAPGPGVGVAAGATKLTGAAQTAANDTLDGLEQLANHIFDAGEGGLQAALKVVDGLQTSVSNVLTTVTAKVTGADVGELPTVPTADIADGLTGTAQDAANKALNGLQQLANSAFDVGEEATADLLGVADAAQTRVSGLLSTLTGLLAKQVGPPKG